MVARVINVKRVKDEIESVLGKIEYFLEQFEVRPTLEPWVASQKFSYTQENSSNAVNVNIEPFHITAPDRFVNLKQPVGVDIVAFFKGWLTFVENKANDQLIIGDYGTRVEYYRRRSKTYVSLCSIHYDFEKKLKSKLNQNVLITDHPVYHAQLDNSCRMFKYSELNDEHVKLRENDNFSSDFRIPTVQLDIFSAIFQFCADTMYTKSQSHVLKEIQKTCDFFQGIDVTTKNGKSFTNQRGIHLY